MRIRLALTLDVKRAPRTIVIARDEPDDDVGECVSITQHPIGFAPPDVEDEEWEEDA